MKKTSYTIEPITNEDFDEVVHFFRKFFCRQEPLCVAIEILDKSNTTCQELEDDCTNCIPEGLSLKAVSTTGDLLGICLNRSLIKNKNKNDEKIENSTNVKFKKILKLLSVVEKLSDVFGRYPTVEKILDIEFLSVDESFRSQGISKSLVDKTIEIAKEQNFPLVKVDCTSHFSAKAALRLGFQCISTLNYDDYINDEGEKIFHVKSPHTCLQTFVMPLCA